MGKFGTSIIRFSFLVQYYYTLGSFTGQFPVISFSFIHENYCILQNICHFNFTFTNKDHWKLQGPLLYWLV